jgi:hypothetical protein
MNAGDIRDAVSDAIRYWEPRRLVYNAALALIVFAYFAAYWPDSGKVVSLQAGAGSCS